MKNVKFESPNVGYNAFLNLLKSPEQECSIVKNVPIDLLDSVKIMLRETFPEKKFIVRYRGPRQSVGAISNTCWKRFAKSAAIYFAAK